MFSLKFILIGISALLVGLYLQLFGFNPPFKNVTVPIAKIEGFFWPNQKPISKFEMVDHNNQKFDQTNFHSNWNFVFFGYTHCPDICPITMNTMRQARDILSKNPQVKMNLLNFVFISVDGERDSPDHLHDYISFFGDNFVAASGSKDQVDSLTGQLGVPYSIDEHAPGDKDYLVGHSGAVFLISPDNTLASIYQSPHTASEITARFLDIQKFIDSNKS